MGGAIDGEMTRDPVGYRAYDQYWEPNIFVRIENTGNHPIVNPWLRRTDQPDTRHLQSIVDFVLKPGMSDAEKARALWEFEIKRRFHATTDDDEVSDAVKVHNCYGYTLCQNESLVMADLWRKAGLKIRKGFPNGHSTTEVYYDKGWHLLDSDEGILCLLRDNKTIASEAQIVADHDLMKCVHTYGPLCNDNRMRDEGSAALHYWEGPREGEHPSLTGHSMSFTLRPGEAITWAWNPAGRFHENHSNEIPSSEYERRHDIWRSTQNIMNGSIRYAPDLSESNTLKYLDVHGLVLRPKGPYGAGLYLEGADGSVIISVTSAYPVVGGHLDVDHRCRDAKNESIQISLSFDNGKHWQQIRTDMKSEYARITVDLNKYLAPTNLACYTYLLRFDILAETLEPLVCIKGFSLNSIVQMARLAMPGLSLGTNAFIYTDQSLVPSQVTITHCWRECPVANVPGSPAGAIYPPDGGIAEGTRFTFLWHPPTKEPQAIDYEFQLGEFPDFHQVLSPNFHKLISRTANRGTAAFEIPYAGLLNPDTTYYWRVRARSDNGIWGPWSKTFSFRPQAPAVPVAPAVNYSCGRHTVRLSWKPGFHGTVPIRYRIYGSTERGFTASDQEYEYNAGLDGTGTFPPNLLYETRDAESSWNIPPDKWRPFYRISAIDKNGIESGPSDMAELDHPIIITEQLPVATAGVPYQATIHISASMGHLVSSDENGMPYQLRFHGGDQPIFELLQAPAGLTIHPSGGYITGTLSAGMSGDCIVVVALKDEQGNKCDKQKYYLKVMPQSTASQD